MRRPIIHPEVKHVIVRLCGHLEQEDVARYLGISEVSVRKIMQTFKEHGVPHLDRLPNLGRKRLLGLAQDIVCHSLV